MDGDPTTCAVPSCGRQRRGPLCPICSARARRHLDPQFRQYRLAMLARRALRLSGVDEKSLPPLPACTSKSFTTEQMVAAATDTYR